MSNYNDQYAQGVGSGYQQEATVQQDYVKTTFEQAQVPPNSGYTQNVYVQGQVQPQSACANGVPYVMTETDRTLRLIAFIFDLLVMIACSWTIIPLAWMIPMTVTTWRIYKGQRPNTTAFGVCTLIFFSLISGILLLCSTKNAR